MGLRLVRSLGGFYPRSIKLCLGLVWSGEVQALPGILVALDVFAFLCLYDSSLQSIDTERNRAAADEE
jgi:hypothetical protein